MKTFFLLFFTVVLQFLRIIAIIGKKLFLCLHLLFSYVLDYILLFKQDLSRNINQTKAKSEMQTKVNEVIIKQPVKDKNDIMGQTKTQFISELPKLRSIEPYLSENLEKESKTDYVDEDEIDPDDVETDEKDVRDIIAEQEAQSQEYNAETHADDLSSGATIEELSQTYETLANKNASAQQDEMAGQILSKVEGTVFSQWFLMMRECTMKAKELMDGDDADLDQKENNFDMNKFV